MPQMAPLSWIILFVIFATTFLLFSVISYFLFPLSATASLKSSGGLSSSPFNWKW
uniref:ATP synthase complex subunit 8 n=1 Tax=Ephemerella sp. Yunnan-2018 TaxID=2748056 RepID=A0A7D6JPG0_9INSE|nr:ATP synthase F0 subunit 8 [Ephemerella sp. Yunnan-2018]QLP88959.1 ATP synthase F0 subunit 8 [Ephemerella sp. Yunnan-2018]